MDHDCCVTSFSQAEQAQCTSCRRAEIWILSVAGTKRHSSIKFHESYHKNVDVENSSVPVARCTAIYPMAALLYSKGRRPWKEKA